MKKNKLITYFSEQKGGNKTCPFDSEKAKELHSCPYLEDIKGDYDSLCDCGENATIQCAEDI